MTWWFAPAPRGRIAVLRVLVYLYIPIDVLLTGSWVRSHAALGATLYQPLLIARVLHLPIPTAAIVDFVEVAVVIAAVVAATGRWPRITGSAAAILYLLWMLIAMSYGKVDHDRFAFIIALAVLPTVGVAHARDRELDERAGWALRCVQVAVVLTYFLSAWAKIRFGGWNWPTGAVLEQALIRRHTFLSTWMINRVDLLVPMQFAMIALELLSPVILLARTDRSRTVTAIVLWSVHLTIYAGVSILFLPHCVAIFAFVPLEIAWQRILTWARRGAAPAATGRPESRPAAGGGSRQPAGTPDVRLT